MILDALREVAVAIMNPVVALNAQREGNKRNMIEVASVCVCVISPYSFQRNVRVATLSTSTRMDAAER